MSRRNLIALCLMFLSVAYAKFYFEVNLRQALKIHGEKSQSQSAELTRKKVARMQEKADVLGYKMDLISSQQDLLIFLEGKYNYSELELVSERHRMEELVSDSAVHKIIVYEVEISIIGSVPQIVEFIESIPMQEACMGISDMKMTVSESGEVDCNLTLLSAGNCY